MYSKVTIIHETDEKQVLARTLEPGDWFLDKDDKLFYSEGRCYNGPSCIDIDLGTKFVIPDEALVKPVDIEIKVKRLSEAANSPKD